MAAYKNWKFYLINTERFNEFKNEMSKLSKSNLVQNAQVTKISRDRRKYSNSDLHRLKTYINER
jgi:hypothetical protein